MQDIDVDQLMTQIRERARQRNDGEQTPAVGTGHVAFDNGHATTDVTELESLHDVRAVSFTSHRRVLGPLVVVVKKILRALLTPILDRQVAYNAATVRAIAILHRQLRQENFVLRQLLAAQSQEVHAAESRLGKVLAAQAQEVLAAQAREHLALKEMLGNTQHQLREELMAAQSRLHDDLHGALATQAQTLHTLRQSSDAANQASAAANRASAAAGERLTRAERRLRRIVHALQPDSPTRVATAIIAAEPKGPGPIPGLEPDFDYAGFEDRFRGREEDIKARQRSYVRYFEGRDNVIDIGSGRGEFLELLRESGIQARGVDLDLDMALLCRDKGLDVVVEDAFTHLETLPDGSVGGVFAAQLIEHFPPRRIIELVKLCYRKLAPGSALILETPNPKCLMVFADSFYRDPSHIQPIHPDTMQFLFEATGFRDVELSFSAPVEAAMRIPPLDAPGADFAAFNQGIEHLNTLLFGFQDYAVIGRKGLENV